MNRARLSATALGLGLSLIGSAATAQTTERTVLGWTPGNNVVAHVVERGERMVDGVSQDYYVQATEVFQPDGTTTLFKHGEASGPVPDMFAAAGLADDGALIRNALLADADGAANPARTHRLVWFAKERIDKPDERTFVCKLRYRVTLLDSVTRRVHTITDAESAGEPSRRTDEARCPTLRASPHWSPDGSVAFVLIDAGETSVGLFANTADLDNLPWAAFAPVVPLAASLTADPGAGAWRALDSGDYAGARTQFEAAKIGGGAALVDAMDGKKNAKKKIDAAYKASGKTARDSVLRAAGYVAAGDSKKVAGWIDQAVKSAKSYDELLGFAAIFEPIDPDIANQLAVHALSHPTAAQSDVAVGWTLLAQGLLDLGQYSKAEEALAKIEKQTPATLAALTTLHLDRRQTNLANNYAEDLLFTNPGDCVGYLHQGRIRSTSGDNNSARALFEAALACDPALEDAAFYAADFARLAGDVRQAKAGFDHFLKIAPARGSDRIRALRREVALRWGKTLARDGVVMTDVSCRKGGAGYLCTGTLKNTTDAEVGEVSVEVRVKGKVVGTAALAKIPAAAMAPFGVSFAAKSLASATVTAGRDKKERAANVQDAR